MILWGLRTRTEQLAVLRAWCSKCGQASAHGLVRIRRLFTLFLIPIVPVSTRHVLTCTYCANSTSVPGERLAPLMTPPPASAGPAGAPETSQGS